MLAVVIGTPHTVSEQPFQLQGEHSCLFFSCCACLHGWCTTVFAAPACLHMHAMRAQMGYQLRAGQTFPSKGHHAAQAQARPPERCRGVTPPPATTLSAQPLGRNWRRAVTGEWGGCMQCSAVNHGEGVAFSTGCRCFNTYRGTNSQSQYFCLHPPSSQCVVTVVCR